MTRRQFFSAAAAAGAVPSGSQAPLILPVCHWTNTRAEFATDQIERFWSNIWPQTIQDFRHCGIEFQATKKTGEIGRSPGGRPVFKELERGVINLVLTDYIPLAWSNGRGLAGLSTRHHGYHLCVLALRYAHAHQFPFFAVNTCVHELLHVLLQDIFEGPPEGWAPRAESEFRIDAHATRLWLFNDGAAIRKAAQAYLPRLRLAATEPA